MKVICTLPNCSESLTGPSDDPVSFVSHAEGMISEELDEDTAAYFLSVPGFIPAQSSGRSVDEEIAALIERAKAVNLTVGANWKLPRLRKEVETAESADAAAKAAGGGSN